MNNCDPQITKSCPGSLKWSFVLTFLMVAMTNWWSLLDTFSIFLQGYRAGKGGNSSSRISVCITNWSRGFGLAGWINRTRFLGYLWVSRTFLGFSGDLYNFLENFYGIDERTDMFEHQLFAYFFVRFLPWLMKVFCSRRFNFVLTWKERKINRYWLYWIYFYLFEVCLEISIYFGITRLKTWRRWKF